MLQNLLHYLSDPLYFLLFSVALGGAYVAVWVVSLQELTRPNRPRFVREMNEEFDQEFGRRKRQVKGARFGFEGRSGQGRAAERRRAAAPATGRSRSRKAYSRAA